MSALSLLMELAMTCPRLFVLGLARHALDPEFSMWVTAEASGFGVGGLKSGFGFGADFGGKAVDGEPVAIDTEAAATQRRLWR